jgi:polysaccharide export outer membrane protein
MTPRIGGILEPTRWAYRCLVWVLVVSQLAMFSGVGLSQPAAGDKDYRFKVGDRLSLTVPDRPGLSQELRIDENGMITIPLVGNVEVVGLTESEAEGKIYEALHALYPSISRNEIAVEALKAYVVYVTGEVSKPGRYTFTDRPNLWEAIREAGGPTADAQLGGVQIVEDESRGATSRVVDVQSALDLGSVDSLPRLNDSDTVVIPSQAEAYTGSFGVNVYGAVLKPGVYRLQGRQDLASAVLLAGGPIDKADLDEVRIIRPNGDGTYTTIKVNLKRHLETGDKDANPPLRPGDTVNVPEQNALAYQFKHNITIVTSVIASVVSLTFLYIRLKD